MMDARTLLFQPHLTVVSGEPDFDLRQIAQSITHGVTIDGRVELEEWLGLLVTEVECAAQVTPKTLDLIGHTRSNESLLALGGWTIDVASPITTAFFRGLAEHDVLPRIGVHTLRLLGCNSAGTAQGRATIGKLAELLGLEVYGTRQLLYAAHYGEQGFRDCWSSLLVAASELGCVVPEQVSHVGDPYPRVLDIDALPAIALGPAEGPCPRHIASTQAARQILQLVRRREGARMPGLLTAPTCELALPSAIPDAYHVAHVLLDGEFLRFYPDGMAATGIVFPVADAGALRRVLASIRREPALNH